MKFSIKLTIEIGGGNPKQMLTRLSWQRRKKQVGKRDNQTCVYCGVYSPNGHVDHIIPLSSGGTDDLSNLAWACSKCNLGKGDKPLAQWLGGIAGPLKPMNWPGDDKDWLPPLEEF